MKKHVLTITVLLTSVATFGQSAFQSEKSGPGPLIFPSFTVDGKSDAPNDWNVTVKAKTKEHFADESIERIKEKKTEQKLKNQILPTQKALQVTGNPPVMGYNFLGNEMRDGTPPDNHLAISSGGKVVAVDNATYEVMNDTGGTKVVSRRLWSNLMSASGLGGMTDMTYDPRVIYDAQADRFIMLIMYGSTSANSKILLFFSKTNNPTAGWNGYQLPANVTSGQWWDYPALSYNDSDVFISGNMFTDAGSFRQGVIYQVGKWEGYSNTPLHNFIHRGVTDSQNRAGFTMTPVVPGHGVPMNGNMWFIASSSGGSTRMNLWKITGYSTGTPTISKTNFTVANYAVPGNAPMSGTTNLLDVGDCRMQSAFILDSVIHFAFTADYGGGYSGMFYGRRNLRTGTTQTMKFGETGFDCAYPAIASLSNSPTNHTVVMSYLISSSTTFPSIKAITVDSAMVASSPIMIKQGTTYVELDNTSTDERWGDYMNACRKHGAAVPTVYVSGCYGTSNYQGTHNYNAWIAELKGTSSVGTKDLVVDATSNMVYPNPISNDFKVKFALPSDQNVAVRILDMQGRVVKELFGGRLPQGPVELSFNKDAMNAGSYLIQVMGNNKMIYNETIIIR